ncbi:MAG: Unknown protein [uncultured Sulfurovum sp.]|uniref:Uncharacterized protein n=1 Tax=uncultured Sulfurovum sp. TaxID=269237 RepID=A0A6S6SZN9_9BACT|nr:MAG: Unknown protein [uncultured Sulfurovum sp.]
MLDALLNRFSATLTIQILENRIKIYDEYQSEIFDDVPNIAIDTKSNGEKYIVEVGKNAIFYQTKNQSVIKPFSNPRILIDDYEVATLIIRFAIEKGLKQKKLFSPTIIVDIKRQFETDITLVERQVVIDVMHNAGAKEVIIKD